MAIKSEVKLTYEDMVLFPEDGKRHEIIDGEHYVSPAPSTSHQRILRALLVVLETFLRKHTVGEVLSAPADVVLSDVDVVQPDILFVSRGAFSGARHIEPQLRARYLRRSASS